MDKYLAGDIVLYDKMIMDLILISKITQLIYLRKQTYLAHKYLFFFANAKSSNPFAQLHYIEAEQMIGEWLLLRFLLHKV